MSRLSERDLAGIIERGEKFIGPEAEAIKFEEYSEFYDQFVGKDLPGLFEHLRNGKSRLRAGQRGR